MNKSDTTLHLPYKISICGRRELPAFKEHGVTHLFSIDSLGSPTATPEWFKGTHWHIEFPDVESKTMALLYGLPAPAKEAVELILEFGDMCRTASRTQAVHLVIHCLAGVSRSTAAAYAIFCMLLSPGAEERAFAHLIKIRPCASPNKLIVKYADELLGRNGKMIKMR